MSVTFVEGFLEFTFDDEWSVQKWDEHKAFREGIMRMQRCEATDFCGLRRRSLFFVEVKDFRGYRIENRRRLLDEGDGGLSGEVARKVRDTIAGLVGARRMRPAEEATWAPLVDALVDSGEDVQIVLWLEEDIPRQPADVFAFMDQLKRKLRWLTTKVLVCSTRDPRSFPPGVEARNLPRPPRL